MSLNIQQNRDQTKYPTKIQLLRVLWAVVRPLFRWSPRPCFGWRAFLLRIFGAKIGRSVHIYNSVQVQFPWNLQIDDFAAVGERAILYNLGQLRIGHSATISQGSHLCGGSHDYTSPDMILLCEPITIEASAWVCADAFIGPGVTVGEGAVVGARAAVFRNVPEWTIVGGNPAKEIGKRTVAQHQSQ